MTENRQVLIPALSYPISIYILFTGAKSESISWGTGSESMSRQPRRQNWLLVKWRFRDSCEYDSQATSIRGSHWRESVARMVPRREFQERSTESAASAETEGVEFRHAPKCILRTRPAIRSIREINPAASDPVTPLSFVAA